MILETNEVEVEPSSDGKTNTQPEANGTAESAPSGASQLQPKETAKQRRGRSRDEFRKMTAWFSACARCSFFLAGYKLVHGDEPLQAAVENGRPRWLTLEWNQGLCELVQKSFGSRVDIDCYHYNGTCPECRRRFVYTAADEGKQSGQFRIELNPRPHR